jgi:hypothetical protein
MLVCCLQTAGDRARYHAAGVWCSHNMWDRIQHILEQRLEGIQHLKFDQVQLKAAHHQALEDNRLQSIMTEQQLNEAQRECEIKVNSMLLGGETARSGIESCQEIHVGDRTRRLHLQLARANRAARASS